MDAEDEGVLLSTQPPSDGVGNPQVEGGELGQGSIEFIIYTTF